jgi:hypothetical protein
MVEYGSHKLHPSPGQLWRNHRTGEVLFIYRDDAHFGGIWVNGRKKIGKELLRMEHGKDGWRCVYNPCIKDDTEKTDSHSYEFRAK